MTSSNDPIPSLLTKHPRAGLLQVPSIIHRLPRLSAHLGSEIYILRDDLTGFGLGGNKTRKVDYLFGDVLAKGADTVLTVKTTSFSRNAAAAASACGLDFHVVAVGTEAAQNPLSQAFFGQCGTTLRYVPEGETALPAILDQLVTSLREEGKTTYELHPGGSTPIGALGYVHALHDIVDFSWRSGVHFSHIIHSTSSAGTQAGLVVGQCVSGYETEVIGISASLRASAQIERVRDLAESTARLLGVALDPAKIIVDDSFIGPGYAIASEEGVVASGLFAGIEGILLDQVYSGKAAAALLSYAKSGRLENGNVLFIHTGGNAGMFY